MSASASSSKRAASKKKAVVVAQPPIEKPVEPAKTIDERYSLFDYQAKTVEAMQKAEANGRVNDDVFELYSSFGINQNSFGSGKTRTTYRLIEENKLTFESCQKLAVKKFLSNRDGTVHSNLHYLENIRTLANINPNNFYEESGRAKLVFKKFNATVIGMDKKLIGEWEKEAKNVGFTDYIVIQVPSDITNEKMKTMIPILTNDSNTSKTVLISMALWNDFLTAIGTHFGWNYNNKHCLLWKRMVFDDLHATSKCSRVHMSIRVASLFTWFLNATPELMENRMPYVEGNHLNVVVNYLDYYHKVKLQVPIDVYVPPALKVENHYYRGAKIIQALNDALPVEIQEMFATGDYDGAYKYLLGRGEYDDAVQIKDRKPIHELVIGKLQKELNKWEEEFNRYRMWGYHTEGIERRIVELKSKIDGVKKRVEEALEKCECPICMDDCDKNSMTVTKCCSNAFCRSCMGDLFRGKNKVPCPLCRNEITMKELFIFDESGNAVDVKELAEGVRRNPEADNMPTSFQQILEKLLVERPTGKILIFAPYQGTSNSIKVYLKDSRVKYTELTGCTAAIVTKRLKQFEEGEFQVLFLNSKFANSGFNLQYATDIIIISGEQFNLEHPTVKQIVSRVARFPRTEEVPVHVIRPMNIIE